MTTDDRLRRQRRWTTTPELLTLDPRISERAHRLWCRLDRYAGDGSGGGAFPSRKALCVELHTSPATIDRAIAELVTAGWLAKERREAGGVNLYTLIDTLSTKDETALRALIVKDRAEWSVKVYGKDAVVEESAQVSTGGVVTHEDTQPRGGVVTGEDTPSSPVTTGVLMGDEEKEASLRDASPKGKNATADAAAGPDDLTVKRAEKIAREWHDRYLALHGKPIGYKHFAVRTLIREALIADITETEIKTALDAIGNTGVSVPSKQQFERTIADIRAGRTPGAGYGRQRTNVHPEPGAPRLNAF